MWATLEWLADTRMEFMQSVFATLFLKEVAIAHRMAMACNT